ncbi:MAG TPA: molybdenum cofactor guanylyltransferase [Phycisphaerae bacterium]|nr:molybdenum cofactor guanylyltransferase [Phycisphaerae bacterium]
MRGAGDDLWPHTGAILCGGAGRRMGQPKAGLVLPDGGTMIERVFGAMSAVCREVILVGGGASLSPPMRELRRVEDRLPQLGPIGGVEALLASGFDNEYLIAPCDVFLVVPDVFRLLVQPSVHPPAVLFRQDTGQSEPLIGRYDASTHPVVVRMIAEGQLAMHELARRAGASYIPVPDALIHALRNANTPADLI